IVIAPNQMFISYLENSTPELDLQGIKHDTYYSLSHRILGIKMPKEPYQLLADLINAETNGLVEEEEIWKYKGSLSFKNAIDTYFEFKAENQFPKRDLNIKSEFVITKEKVREIYNGYNHLPINRRRDKTVHSIRSLVDQEIVKRCKRLEDQFEEVVHTWVDTLPKDTSTRKNLFQSLEEALKIRINNLKTEY